MSTASYPDFQALIYTEGRGTHQEADGGKTAAAVHEFSTARAEHYSDGSLQRDWVSSFIAKILAPELSRAFIIPLTSGLIGDSETHSSREVRLKLPPPSWRWETGDGCAPSANANNKTGTIVNPSELIITLTADQSYRRSEGVKAQRGDIDSSFACLLERPK